MKIRQVTWNDGSGWSPPGESPAGPGRAEWAGSAELPELVLVFASRAALEDRGLMGELAGRFPGGMLVGCSTAGEIAGGGVSDDSVAATSLRFERGFFRALLGPVGGEGIRAAGARVARELAGAGLRHVLAFAGGHEINGSELVRGMAGELPPGVSLTGGIAGDGARFGPTAVLFDGEATSDAVVAVGLYGAHLSVGIGSVGGWDPFGPERLITRSRGNVLYEVDGISALGLYKKYLGDYAAELPASGLLFPLALRAGDSEVVRTLLAVDEASGSMTFAGDVPEGGYVRLMKANFDRLIDGATAAAQACAGRVGAAPAEFGLLISCVGRRMVLRQRVEEEIEGVRGVIGREVPVGGFYSYGEISPLMTPGGGCELHNQTMTVTTLSEHGGE